MEHRVTVAKNLLIHLADGIHNYLFRHYPPHIPGFGYVGFACDTLANSKWWACDQTDWYCRKFRYEDEELDSSGVEE